jgi:chromosome segregation ATPase
MATPPKQARSLATEQKMLDAAEELLSAGDARQVTIEKVIALSGATSGSFYARFGSVEGLFDALHQRYVDTIYQSTLLEALNSGIEQPDLRKALHHIIKTMLEFGYKKRKLLAYFVTRNEGGDALEIRLLAVKNLQAVLKVHRDEVARAEQRLRIEAMENKSVEDYGVGPEELLAEYGPEVMVPPSPPAPGDEVNPDDPEPEPYPYVRTQQESRLAAAERSLALLGKVNPLALEEFSALEERHKFLGEQLEDLRKSRNDLMSVIRDVDARVQEVFSQAYEDTAREFMLVFSRLFPGGEARMILTEPNDLLNSGVEIEARPPGKTYKRLSLLSGGEQSLTAVAFLIALFKSRPSPFYILDEVEAALDDVNLGRLLEILAELRTNSQLLIITHQKRTMEIADALYGVSMRGDGVTQVISQRITHDDHDNPEQRADAQMANNS